MGPLLKILNRGPIFRLTHAIARQQERRRRENWRRRINMNSSIDSEVVITGDLESLDRIEIGAETEIQRYCRIHLGDAPADDPKLTIGSRVFIGQGTHLSVMRPMTIGHNTLIGAYCYLLTNNHRFNSRDLPIRDQGYDCSPLTVEEDVWVGANCVIMAGLVIGKGAVIGAGGVVTKNVGPYEIWGGVPARKIGERPQSK